MTSHVQHQSADRYAPGSRASRILVREMWATVAIVAMWLAVLFVGVDGGQATFRSVDSSVTTIPSVVFVALFAAIGTGSVAKRVFGATGTDH
jgi:hypothetical protein